MQSLEDVLLPHLCLVAGVVLQPCHVLKELGIELGTELLVGWLGWVTQRPDSIGYKCHLVMALLKCEVLVHLCSKI